MHRISSTSGGWNQSEGLIFLEQTPAPFVLITAADTDIQTLAAAVTKLPPSFPALRVANLLQLQQQLSIDTYGEQVLELAQVIILRLLGGRSYWGYGLEVVQEIVQRNGRTLIVMPGDDAFDPDLISQSTVPLGVVNQVWQYFSEGGVENFVNALQFISDSCLLTAYNPAPPQPIPRVGLYEWGVGEQGSRGAGEQGGRGGLELRSSTFEPDESTSDTRSSTFEPDESTSELRSSTFELDESTSELRSSTSELDESTSELRSSTFELDESTSDTRSSTSELRSSTSDTRSSTSELRSSTSDTRSSASESQISQSPVPNPQSPVPNPQSPIPKIGILFYRAHYLAGNTKVIDALCEALVQKNLQPVPVFVSSLREPDVQVELSEFFQPKEAESIAVLLNTTSFSLARLESETPQTELWQKLDVPVLQVILSGGSIEQWESQFQGLSPRDIGMNVALPEVDGRIITRAVSFKALQTRNPHLETDVVIYEPVSDRIEFVAKLAANWARLRSKPPQERRIALILANYPNRNGRLANGVGLDTPASCVEILQALHQAGYEVENPPTQGDELIERLTDGVTNDPEGRESLPVHQSVSWEEYQKYFASLPPAVQQGISERWGLGTGDWGLGTGEKKNGGDNRNTQYPILNTQSPIPVPGIQLGNIFVGIQPARGYDNDPSLNYHAPDLEPTHDYLAFYYWVRETFGADAVVHVGKHGNLEWLPGKSVALSSNCYPEVAFGALPHLYPFIVNDPGEGSQAKRRAQAVIIDHLTPPMTRAELYGSLQQLENLIDEYYEADSLDPSRLPVIRDRIHELVIKENLHLDLGIQNETEIFKSESLILNSIGGYLCELKEAQIRDGLHIFGQCPQGRQLRDLIVAIARIPNRHSPGITRAIAQDWGLDFDPLTADLSMTSGEYSIVNGTQCRTLGDIVEVLEEHAALLVEQLINQDSEFRIQNSELLTPNSSLLTPNSPLSTTLNWIRDRLLPALQKTPEEITHLLHGLDGGYVPSAPSGAPTRGRPEVLPTGKNFYSVDIRAIPTETAWDIGRKAAETLVEYYTQEHGEYPKTLGLSLWGTATMRTGGDDIAEALALLGVQPVWDGAARRVVDFEILPLAILGRPRVDVTLRISGFFRDAFPNLIDLFDQAVSAVADLDEPPEQNPLADAVRQETDLWTSQGLTIQEAVVRSRYRIFGSRPGAYGAGLQGLIESQNWTDDEDLARAYINWSSYAYSSGNLAGEQGSRGAGEQGSRGAEILPNSQSSIPTPNSSLLTPNSPLPSPEAFEQRLSQMQIVLHNQDNREHDLLDSDDYYQFQGGLTAAVRSLQGKNPQTYFGDNSIPAQPRVRQLKEEIARVYRSRVVNPKWIAGVMRHGYKGAFEMAATVDYLFAYDATAKCVEDYMYQGIVDAYLLDPVVVEFIQQKNPYALRDIAEKLLEAHKRNLWEDVKIGTLEALRNLVHQAEAVIEEKSMV